MDGLPKHRELVYPQSYYGLLVAVRFGCSGQKFVRRMSIGLTNDNAADKIRNG